MELEKLWHRWNAIILCCCLMFCGCSADKKPEVGTDIEFVESQFPKIENIEKVRYYYNVKSSNREIGLQNIEFSGIIKIGELFLKKIDKEYQWKATKKSKKIVPKSILLEEGKKQYHFLYDEEFSDDGKYISHSWVGYFYLDREERVLYFECEW